MRQMSQIGRAEKRPSAALPSSLRCPHTDRMLRCSLLGALHLGIFERDYNLFK